MKVVDLHPEELIDKLFLNERELSCAERERLDAHLAQCSACRFEIGVRTELEQEALPLANRPQLSPPGPVHTPPERVAASIRPRSRRRWPLVLLAAALVLCAGGATAAVITGAVPARWLPWVPERVQVAVPAEPSVKGFAKSKRVAPKASPLAEASTEAVALTQLSPPSPTASSTPSVPAFTQASRVAKAAPSPAHIPAIAFPSVPPVSEATVQRTSDAASVAAAAALFAEANRARRDGNADRAVSLYGSLQTRYPGSSESALSRALLAQLLLDRGSPEAALAGFDRYLAQDAPVLGAEALVGRARALEQLGKTARAAVAWAEVQKRFPGSVHARLAAARLAALGMR